jgi:hypothetical protein
MVKYSNASKCAHLAISNSHLHANLSATANSNSNSFPYTYKYIMDPPCARKLSTTTPFNPW